MPIYDYRCPTCGNVFELMVKHSDVHPGTCPNCMNGKSLERLPAAPGGFKLKGDGFYKPSQE